MPSFEVKWGAENAFGRRLIGFCNVVAADEEKARDIGLFRAEEYSAVRSVKVTEIRSVRRLGWWEAIASGAR